MTARSCERSRPRSTGALILLAVFAQQSVSCAATSRIGTAKVTDVAGAPCFGLPDERETRGTPIRLYSLHVSEARSADWKTLPAQTWGFTIAPAGNSVAIEAGSCIRYGDAPASAAVRQAPQRLEPYRVYTVEINARPADGTSRTRGYKAEFCVKSVAGGPVAVQAIPWDEAAGRWRYDLCARP